MKKTVRFIGAVVVALILVYLLFFFPFYTLIGLVVILAGVGIYDLVQKDDAILRNFPVIGHLRYLLQGIGPEIRQYFIEMDTEGKPLTRNQRNYIYTHARKDNTTHPFGTEHDLQREGMAWVTHSMYPTAVPEQAPRIRIGGSACTQPYESSLLNISAMSFGSLSKNAVMALNLGAKAGGFYHNTGEGSISKYHLMGGDLCYQFGTGYFGCRSEDGRFSAERFAISANRPEVKLIEIKLSQGAKPGHGGILPAVKNNHEIAEARGIQPGIDVLSPPRHTAFDSPEGLLHFVQQLRELSNGKPIGFKLCLGSKSEFQEVCKQMVHTGILPDFISVDGAEGGTGAAPIVFSDHVGMPWENALVFVNHTLRQYGLRNDIKIITAGKIVDGFDMFKAFCFGADLCNSARAMMLALGCIQALECHHNTCPTGVATNKPNLFKGLVVSEKWKQVAQYHHGVIHDFLELFAAAGCHSMSDMHIGLINRQVNRKSVCYSDIYPELRRETMASR